MAHRLSRSTAVFSLILTSRFSGRKSKSRLTLTPSSLVFRLEEAGGGKKQGVFTNTSRGEGTRAEESAAGDLLLVSSGKDDPLREDSEDERNAQTPQCLWREYL